MASAPSLQLRAAADTDPGRVHTIDQDSALAVVRSAANETPAGLFVVADGVGGHQAGDVASRLAVETIRHELTWLLEQNDLEETQPLPAVRAGDAPDVKLQRRLARAIERANEVITRYARENPHEAGNLGSTVTAVLVEGDRAAVANIGDSRTYLLRDGELHQITRDHSYVARLVEEGQLRPEEVYSHPRRNVITRSLGHDYELELDLWTLRLQVGDRLLLCSDGLWEMVQGAEQIRHYLQQAEAPEAAVGQLISAANEKGGSDNIGIVVVYVEAS
ncbi:MAG: Stp1/IreP family PP2C-type Ser/Thr phosphatase [Candidatus Promineifilaceae bacterium]|nr:Stp1/IreP family PP2C-type Ser/Thr phosphatase [Candidatus Promineifilaceae bacterium]